MCNMNNLIINAFAYDFDMRSGENFSVKISEKNHQMEVYLKNSFVSLVSAKKNNPECDVWLCTNIEIPDWLRKKLDNYEIDVYRIPFDRFRVEDDVKWGLSYYKLCVLSHLLSETDYDNYCLIDTDTYCANTFQPLFEEIMVTNKIYVYNNFESYHNATRRLFIEEYKLLYNSNPVNSEHYSSAEIAGSKEILERLIKKCSEIFQLIQSKKFCSACGDEFIIFCVLNENPELFASGNAYFENFYTIEGYHVITTKFAFEQIPIWHMLFEKTGGMLAMYKYINKYNRLPSGRKLWRIIGLPQPDKNFGTFGWLVRRIKARTAQLFRRDRL